MSRTVVKALIIICLIAGPGPAMAVEQDQLSMELLEFLADWSVDEEGWLDPMELEEMDLPEQEHDNDETAKK